MQERYHEYIKRQFKLDRDRQDHMEHDISLEWIRFFERGHNQNNYEEIQLDREPNKKSM